MKKYEIFITILITLVGLLLLSSSVFNYVSSGCQKEIDNRLRGELFLYINLIGLEVDMNNDWINIYGRWTLKTLYEESPELHVFQIQKLAKYNKTYSDFLNQLMNESNKRLDDIDMVSPVYEQLLKDVEIYQNKSIPIIYKKIS